MTSARSSSSGEDTPENLSSGEDEELRGAVDKFLKAKPTLNTANKSKRTSFDQMRARLQVKKSSEASCSGVKTRNSDRKKVEDSIQAMRADFSALHEKFNAFSDCLFEVLDRVEEIEERVAKLEADRSSPSAMQPSATYAAAAAKIDSTRIERLEVSNSEQQRLHKLLQVTLTDPKIDKDKEDLESHITEFLQEEMKMERREVDSNMVVTKGKRDNTVIVKLSDRKFKVFLFAAMKRLRRDSGENLVTTYLNENLSSYNFYLLMKMKRERKKRREEGVSTFESVYSFEGRVYAKKKSSDPSGSAVLIKSEATLTEYLQQFNAPATSAT